MSQKVPPDALGPVPCVIYAAKSTEDHTGSIESQTAAVRAAIDAAAAREVYAEPQADERFSGYRRSRGPGLARAIELAEQAAREHGRAELWAYDPDRFARGNGKQARHLGGLYFNLLEAGVKLRAVVGDEDLRDPIRAVLRGERNHEDSEAKSGHVHRGKRGAFERGELGGGPIPDGYEALREVDERGRVRRTIRRNPKRAPTIELIYELHEQGWGEPSIMRELNRRGLRTEKARPWDRRSVQDKLTNAVYAGAVVWHRGQKDEEVNWDGQHPALIEPERWQRLTAARRARDKAHGSDRSPRGRHHSNHALARLARCVRCGEVMRPITGTYRRKSDGGRRRTYQCQHVHASTGLCDQPSIDAEAVDAHVIAELERYLGDFECWREQIISGQESERQKLQRQLDRAREELSDVERKVSRLEAQAERFLEAGEQDKADAAFGLLAKRRSEREAIGARLSATESALESVPAEVPADVMLDFYNGLQAAVCGRLDGADTVARVNEALRDLFECFYLDTRPGGAGVQVLPVLLGGRFDWPQTGASVATGDDAIRPPLRALEAPSAKSGSSQA